MGKHLTLFETQEQYNMIADSLMHPNVTYIEKGNLIYNSIETVLICKFVTTEANQEVSLYYEITGGDTGSGSGTDSSADTGSGSGDGSDSFNISEIISKIRIDGVENEINSKYTFTEAGEHVVEYEFVNGVTNIPNKLFYYCDMTEIRIPDIIKVIGNGVFDGCPHLQKIHIPNGVTSIGNYAFNRCLVENINIPDSVTTIGEFCFANTSNINKCTIGKSVTSIGANMFHYCNSEDLNIIIKAVNPPTVLQVTSQNADLIGELLNNNVSIRIYVPDESVNLYRNAPGWDTYSEYIVSIKNY